MSLSYEFEYLQQVSIYNQRNKSYINYLYHWDYFDNQSVHSIQRDIDLNITALTTLSHAFVNIAAKHGQKSAILNIASLAALLPIPRFAVYSATKSNVLRLSNILSYELKKQQRDISVTCICPGGVLTEFSQQAGQELKGELGMMTSRDVAQQSVTAMFKGKRMFIPGVFNKISALTRFLPLRLKRFLLEQSMVVAVKDR